MVGPTLSESSQLMYQRLCSDQQTSQFYERERDSKQIVLVPTLLVEIFYEKVNFFSFLILHYLSKLWFDISLLDENSHALSLSCSLSLRPKNCDLRVNSKSFIEPTHAKSTLHKINALSINHHQLSLY